MAKTRAKRGTLSRVLRYVRRYWFLLLLSMVLAAATVALTLYLPILVGDAIDLILAPGKVDFAGILPILWTAAALTGLTALFQWAMNSINNKITYQVVRDIRNEAFRKLYQAAFRPLARATRAKACAPRRTQPRAAFFA